MMPEAGIDKRHDRRVSTLRLQLVLHSGASRQRPRGEYACSALGFGSHPLFSRLKRFPGRIGQTGQKLRHAAALSSVAGFSVERLGLTAARSGRGQVLPPSINTRPFLSRKCNASQWEIYERQDNHSLDGASGTQAKSIGRFKRTPYVRNRCRSSSVPDLRVCLLSLDGLRNASIRFGLSCIGAVGKGLKRHSWRTIMWQ